MVKQIGALPGETVLLRDGHFWVDGGPERGFPGKNPGGLSDAVHSEIRRSLARVAP